MSTSTATSLDLQYGNSADIAQLREVLLACIHPEPSITKAHLRVIERNLIVDGTQTLVHCYAPTLDGNGRIRIDALAEFMRNRVIRFVIPRKDIQAAEEAKATNDDMSVYFQLHERAKRAFTSVRTTGEGGEFLLFALAEKEFHLTQLLTKMSLKTATRMHYHGSDGVYAKVDDKDTLCLYWGESKLYENPKKAITDCLISLAPYLIEGTGEGSSSTQDIMLLNEHADIGDEGACAVLKRFLDPHDPQSQRLKICGLALVTFDNDAFPKEGAPGGVWEEIEAALKSELPDWRRHISRRVGIENLSGFDIHFICLPMARADDFRQAFLRHLGVV